MINLDDVVKVCIGEKVLLGDSASVLFWNQMSNGKVAREPSGVAAEVKVSWPAAHMENDSWRWRKTWIFCAFHIQVVLVNSFVGPSNTTFSLVDIVSEWIQESEEVMEPFRRFVTVTRFLLCSLSFYLAHLRPCAPRSPCKSEWKGVKNQITSDSFLPEGVVTEALSHTKNVHLFHQCIDTYILFPSSMLKPKPY